VRPSVLLSTVVELMHVESPVATPWEYAAAVNVRYWVQLIEGEMEDILQEYPCCRSTGAPEHTGSY